MLYAIMSVLFVKALHLSVCVCVCFSLRPVCSTLTHWNIEKLLFCLVNHALVWHKLWTMPCARTGLLNSIIHDGRTAIQTEREQNTKPELHIKWWPSTAVYHIKVNQKCLSNQTLQANIFTFNCTLPTICKIINMYRNTDNFIIQVTEFAPKQNKVWCISSNWYQKHNVGSVSPHLKKSTSLFNYANFNV